MDELEQLRDQIQYELEIECRVCARIQAITFRDIMGTQSRWQLEREVSLFASQHGWEMEMLEGAFCSVSPNSPSLNMIAKRRRPAYGCVPNTPRERDFDTLCQEVGVGARCPRRHLDLVVRQPLSHQVHPEPDGPLLFLLAVPTGTPPPRSRAAPDGHQRADGRWP